MTTSYQYRQCDLLNRMAKDAGFRVVSDTYHNADQLSLMAADDALPVYSRDMPIISGEVEHLLAWLQGWHQSRAYLSMLKLANGDKITKAEQAHAERIRRAKDYTQRRKMLKVLRETHQ